MESPDEIHRRALQFRHEASRYEREQLKPAMERMLSTDDSITALEYAYAVKKLAAIQAVADAEFIRYSLEMRRRITDKMTGRVGVAAVIL